MIRHHKRWLLAGMSTTAAVLVSVSIAYACTTWQGTITVVGSGPNAGSVTAQGWDSEMIYCPWGEPSGTAGMADNTSGTVTAEIDPATGDCADNVDPTLPNATYDIRWEAGTWDPGTQTGVHCMGPGDTSVDVGNLTVSSGSGGPTSSSSFNPGNPGPIIICVINSNRTFGNQVPVSVI